MSAEERFADGIVRSLRSTLAFRRHVLALTAILSCPVGAALSMGELVPGTLVELDQDCSSVASGICTGQGWLGGMV